MVVNNTMIGEFFYYAECVLEDRDSRLYTEFMDIVGYFSNYVEHLRILYEFSESNDDTYSSAKDQLQAFMIPRHDMIKNFIKKAKEKYKNPDEKDKEEKSYWESQIEKREKELGL